MVQVVYAYVTKQTVCVLKTMEVATHYKYQLELIVHLELQCKSIVVECIGPSSLLQRVTHCTVHVRTFNQHQASSSKQKNKYTHVQ